MIAVRVIPTRSLYQVSVLTLIVSQTQGRPQSLIIFEVRDLYVSIASWNRSIQLIICYLKCETQSVKMRLAAVLPIFEDPYAMMSGTKCVSCRYLRITTPNACGNTQGTTQGLAEPISTVSPLFWMF